MKSACIQKKPTNALGRRDYKYGYLFILPMLIGFTLFTLLPTIATFVLSFFDYSLLTGSEFCGFDNYVKIFTKDKTFVTSILHTLQFTVMFLPANICLCLGVAMLLYKPIKGVGFFRTVVFTPYVTNIISWSLMWKFLLQNDGGLINMALEWMGLEGRNWLYTSDLIIPLVVVVTLLKGFGLNTILFIGALQEVPEMYYEAASLDGVSKRQQFRYITLPMISPTIFLTIVMTVIGSLKIFAQVNVITEGGGPGTSGYVWVFYIYQKAFKLQEYGYGSALAALLFIVVLALTLLQWQMRRKWVYYEE